MSRVHEALRRAGQSSSVDDGDGLDLRTSHSHNTYAKLIRRLFDGPCAVAMFGVGSGDGVGHVCEDIAAELSWVGRRAVVVSVRAFLDRTSMGALDQTSFVAEPVESGGQHKYWLWPARSGQHGEPFGTRGNGTEETWLECLRRNFDAVLLDCHTSEAPGAGAIGAMAQAAVLIVDAGRTSQNQILRDQRTLQATGVKLAGCILTQVK